MTASVEQQGSPRAVETTYDVLASTAEEPCRAQGKPGQRRPYVPDAWKGRKSADTLKKIKDSGAVTMGVRESSGGCPTPWVTASSPASTSRSAERVLADLQKQLGLAKLEIKYQPVTSQNRIPLVQNGTVDIECGSTTNNATRQKDVSFAVTTYVEEVRIAVKANSGITSIAQLNGKNVATTTGTTSVQHLRKHERANGVDFKEVFGKDHADSFLLLESGRADAFVMDGQILAGNIAKSKNPATSRSSARCCRSSRSPSCCARTTRPSRRRWTTASRP
jgi:glutamate/aspartate transport system substrate-binding protein